MEKPVFCFWLLLLICANTAASAQTAEPIFDPVPLQPADTFQTSTELFAEFAPENLMGRISDVTIYETEDEEIYIAIPHGRGIITYRLDFLEDPFYQEIRSLKIDETDDHRLLVLRIDWYEGFTGSAFVRRFTTIEEVHIIDLNQRAIVLSAEESGWHTNITYDYGVDLDSVSESDVKTVIENRTADTVSYAFQGEIRLKEALLDIRILKASEEPNEFDGANYKEGTYRYSRNGFTREEK